MKAICIGHSTYDIILPLNEYPKENLKYRINKTYESGGGPASNAAYLLGKWKISTSIASAIGDDLYGNNILEEFKKINVNTDYLEKYENFSTSSSYIVINNENASRTIITNKDTPKRELKTTPTENYDLILVDGEHPETAHTVLDNNKNAISILDAGRLNDDILSLGKKVKYLICSKDFAEIFSKQKIDITNNKALINIHKKLEEYFNTTIIITLGENGTFAKINEEYKIIPSIKVNSIDTTGAGDIFHGAFLYFISQGYSLLDAIYYSSITSALSTTKIGSRYAIPELEEILEYGNTI